MVSIFFCFRPDKPFLGKSGKRKQNCQFKLKLCTKTNLNLCNSIMAFTFSVFDHKYLSWANLVQKFKIACSKWNLIQRLIRMCKTQWGCLFYLAKWLPFLANLIQKIAIVSLSLKSVINLMWIWRFNSDFHFFVFSTGSTLFFGKLFQISKLFFEAET